jgi:hypothetical protein
MTEPLSTEEHLSQLLNVDRFDPPTTFAERARISDPAEYQRAAARRLSQEQT